MTAKRDSKRKPKKGEQPKVEKETLKDLSIPHPTGDQVKGGSCPIVTN